MTPNEFIDKWKAAELKERSAAQEHFLDLCRLLDEPTPAEADPHGDWYTFERGASKTTGGEGWADVWKRGHFGWEYKGKRRDMRAAFAQLQQYAVALENPPLLVVCDLENINIHTNWTNTVSKVHEIKLEELRDASTREKLKWVMTDPEKLRPGQTRQALTEQAAGEFAKLALRLRQRRHDPEQVAHFINRLVFCMFAEDIGLLPNAMFSRMLEHARPRPEEFPALASDLFRAMKDGGRIGFEKVDWFNGGLFDDDTALPLDKDDIALTLRAAKLGWDEIDPSIFGTLFERGLDPDKRSQLGAHYTDHNKIMLIVEPVIVRPWLAEWEVVKQGLVEALERAREAKNAGARTRGKAAAERLFRAFLDRLRAFTILDPACGSGNFLYLGLHALKDLEHRVMVEAEALGLAREFPAVGPQNVKGIEINPYAAELARVTVWIGEIQWMRKNGFDVSRNPILKPLDNIECRDALFSPVPDSPWPDVEHLWPEADVIIGNPPFLGDKLMISYLGEEYVSRLRSGYGAWLPGGADLVCYWFAIADRMLREQRASRVGLVATNSIRGGANRRVLQAICEHHVVTDAWSDESWTVEGAAVRVSLICFTSSQGSPQVWLDGRKVPEVFADLTGGAIDLTSATRLAENRGRAFQGPVKVGPFDVSGDQARSWLELPSNVNGQPNADVLRPWANGMDVTRRPSDTWIIDFGERPEARAAEYEQPFEYTYRAVKPLRDSNRRERRRRYWWQHGETVPGLKLALASLSRYILTPRVSKYRLFVWMHSQVLPDSAVVAITRDDDPMFGILHSRFHEAWSLRMGTWLGKGNDPRYTPSTTFETFPFPEGLTPDLPALSYADDPRAERLAAASVLLNERRENWLNPPELVRRKPEVVPGFPDRLLPVDDNAAALLKKRTLTKLYNERPAWLANAHAELDAAVAAAYGWPEDIDLDDALARLFELNQRRADRA